MPGITGLSAPEDGPITERLARMERELYPASGLRRETGRADGFACALHARRPCSGIAERYGACLAFDGYVLEDGAPRGRDLPGWLLDGFLERGPAFLEGLDGSYQVAVHHQDSTGQGATWLFADPTASRRLFYVADERGLFVAPEVAPLTGLARGERIDPANLVHFLASGRFFAGHTLLSDVRQLLPGESVRWRDGHLERRRHFLYEARDEAVPDRPGLVAELGERLERAILRAWEHAKNPIMPLTGGYDSRYIFQTLARHVDDRRRLNTLLWGQRMDQPGTDNALAAEIARRAGSRHLSLPWRTEVLPEQFDEMFRAQSGMTELVFTHSDELAVFGTLRDRGFRSMVRGDECFGPKGEEVDCVASALGRVSLARAADLPESGRWLTGGGAAWLAAHDEALEALLAAAPGEPSDLRDTLYGRERLPALLHHHNYHKLHFLEMLNPFLDTEVLRFWSTLPRRCRVDKTLVKESYHTRFGDHLEVPIAQKDNGADWVEALRTSPALAAWVRAKLEALPEPLDRTWFLGRLDAVLHGEPDPAPPTRVPAVKQVARAVVLGEWLR